ncbi:outer membrane beta-barrel protein [Catenovulum agarivorans]|uniref:outer membrane beta-barrel protein n=1 Tax=Catenovulum agarivorans TaxID=1172192 RepID=UPI0002E72A7F|nr:outer membrane beta-barrel protein [Catenovulum agarivorans]
MEEIKRVKPSYLLLLFVSMQAHATNGLTIDVYSSIAHDNNVLRQNSQTSDTLLTLSPNLALTGKSGKHTYQVSYKGDYHKFNQNSQLNQNQHKTQLIANLDLTAKFTANIELGYEQITEEPGTTSASTELLTQFNTLNKSTGKIDLHYGNKDSIGQIVVAYEYNNYNYTNNLQDYRDFDANKLTGTFFYRLAPKTRMLFQTSLAKLDYLDQVAANDTTYNQSSDLNLYLTGVEWAASAKTTGIFKLGYFSKDHVDKNFTDINGLSYFLDVIWQPNSYSKMTLSAERSTQESAQLADAAAYVSTGASIKLQHKLTSKISVLGHYRINNDNLITSQGRSDKRQLYKLSVNHSLANWLEVSLGYAKQTRGSESIFYQYSAGITELGIKIEID